MEILVLQPIGAFNIDENKINVLLLKLEQNLGIVPEITNYEEGVILFVPFNC